MKHLFIDSNIWLSLYHFSSNDLDRFDSIKQLLNKDIVLYIPKQVVDEIKRNREMKIKESFEGFSKFDIKFPNYCKSYDDYNLFIAKYNDLKSMHKKWLDKISEDISNNSLKADVSIKDIFSMCEIIPCDDFVANAEIRYKRGNPPGKDNKYGDAINWECLLNKIPPENDLYIISDDKDYKSPIDSEKINGYLADEWVDLKNAKVHFYTDLASFLNEHAKEIQLRDENNKNDLIQGLIDSPNFSVTHSIISDLNKYFPFSDKQKRRLCFAAIHNSQVEWIIEDEDIKNFYSRLIDYNGGELSLHDAIIECFDKLVVS